MMKKILLSVLILAGIMLANAQEKTVRIYDGKAPGSENWNYEEIAFTHPNLYGSMIRNVVDPTLTIFLPDVSVATGTAVIVCPGGGYNWLSYSSEGVEVAEWLTQKGIAAFVLKYRLNKTPESSDDFNAFLQEFYRSLASRTTSNVQGELASTAPEATNVSDLAGDDGLAAVKYVREHADEFGIDPDKVGIMGFSAGAGVTISSILKSNEGNMPDFGAPIYGGWLYGTPVPENAPPLFILCAADDPISSGSPDLFRAWREAGHPAELHIYAKGGHGFGMQKRGLPVDNWIERFYEWLIASGF